MYLPLNPRPGAVHKGLNEACDGRGIICRDIPSLYLPVRGENRKNPPDEQGLQNKPII